MQRFPFKATALVLVGLSGCSVANTEPLGNVSQRMTAATAEDCLGDQDLDGGDIDVGLCPALPTLPDDAPLGAERVSLGAWEIGTTADGDTYKYGSLATIDAGSRVLQFDGGSAVVNEGNTTCWAKGYYRLRKILQNPPREYVALRAAGFQFRFFQFQTDLRNGPTGYLKISSYRDHLVKWVTVVGATGECKQPTLSDFRAYASSELARRGLPVDANLDAGTPTDASYDGR